MKTFNEFCRAKIEMISLGSKPAIVLRFGPPGLAYSINPDIITQYFKGNVHVPFSERAKKLSQSYGGDFNSMLLAILKERTDLFDEPSNLLSLDYADFIGLPGDIEEVPDELYEGLIEGFWNAVEKRNFTIDQ